MQNLQNDSFFKRVYEVARLIPYGRVTSYGAIARYLGTAGSARMVGWAMNKSPSPPPRDEAALAGEGLVQTQSIGKSQPAKSPSQNFPKVLNFEKVKKGSNLQQVPAHRVVNRNGMLTGKRHFGGSDVMRQLLESEGIEVVDDKVQNFDELLWDPIKEL